jgi:isoleucyl-tRNA synthetase
VIFRAMDQWFIRVDLECGDLSPLFPLGDLSPGAATQAASAQSADESAHSKTFRARALAEIDRVQWIPDWGINRIKSAVQSRPDWCISRQRTWGVPIPAFYDKDGNAILDAQIVRNVADLIEQHGSNVWFEKSAAELWSLVRPKYWKGAEAVTKSNDTLDVWIDSGSSSQAVIAQRPEIRGKDKPFQCDLYLEGSDQHRGWFQSSLLLSLSGNGAAPFKTVLTHGFMVDEDRDKISKSKQGQGGYEKPQTADRYVKDFGADVLRLWVASQDYRNDIVVSEERLKKVSETYRGIRNTLRYQLSNLYDFDPAKHTVPDDQLTGLDRWILSEFSKLEADVFKAYDAYEFHVVYQKVSQFVAVELSAIYHDVVKDRLYTLGYNNPKRRSTQTALYRMVVSLCQMLAPILSFTADEAWEFIPGKEGTSVHLAEWMKIAFSIPENETSVWKNLQQLRGVLLPEIEKARQSKTIGKSLEATVLVKSGDHSPIYGPLTFASACKEDFQELLGSSQFAVEFFSNDPDFVIKVERASGQKCERCWHWEADVGADPKFPTICGRCVKAEQENAALA